MKFVNCCENATMEMILVNTENNKTNEPHKFLLNVLQILDLRDSNKYVALKNYLFITRGEI